MIRKPEKAKLNQEVIQFRLPQGVILFGLPPRTHKVLQAFALALEGLPSLNAEHMAKIDAQVWGKVEAGKSLWCLKIRGKKASPWIPALDEDQVSFERSIR